MTPETIKSLQFAITFAALALTASTISLVLAVRLARSPKKDWHPTDISQAVCCVILLGLVAIVSMAISTWNTVGFLARYFS